MTEEIWVSIEDFEGFYEVSNLGRVRSLDRFITNNKGVMSFIKGRVMSPGDNGHGYLQVTLRKEGNKKKVYVHDLVAKAFIPNLDNLPEVNHKNYNKNDNTVSNLEWMTHSDNIQDYIQTFNIHKNLNSCIFCGKLLDYKKTVCRCCFVAHIPTKRPSKVELISDLIAIPSVVGIGKKYGVTDNVVRRWLKFYKLPYKRNDIKIYIESLQK